MRRDTLKRVLKYAKPHALLLILALISAVISVFMTLYTPILIGDAIDNIIKPGQVNFPEILRILILLAIVVIMGASFQWLLGYCTNAVSQKTVRDIRIDVFNKIEKLPLKTLDSHPHGDLITRVVSDTEQISDGLLQGFTQLFTGLVTILGTLGFMLYVNYKIAIAVIVITPLSLFVASFIAKHSYDKFRELSWIKGELGGYIEESVGNQKIVKTFGHEETAQAEFEEINNRLYDCGWLAQFYSSLTNPCTRFVNSLVYAAVGVLGAVIALNGAITVGRLSSFLTYANQYTKPFNEISGVITELQAAIACAARVFEIIDKPEETSDGDSLIVADCGGKVNLDNVSFSYTKDKKFIENLNLYANPGQRIAIVGPTGCGKTTVINLLMRFYEVNGGVISVDNRPITDITRNSLRSMYGMVLQDTWLFAGSVHDNIAYGKPEATREEVIAAAKSAHAHSFIKRLPNGYDTVLSEDGGNMSQGQKQLLCIARIMLTQPPMLILDEATSSIDTLTEIRIQRAFDKMMAGRTCFIVAHRLSTIREADCILVMKDGRIIEQGDHNSLMKKNGFYTELYNSQFAKTTD